ncbi:hypothetical protein [Jatrophihabitans fulvus]
MQLESGQRVPAARRFIERKRAGRLRSVAHDRTPSTRQELIRFWSSEQRESTWSDIERLLEASAAGGRDQLELFVRTGLENTHAPIEIMSLARHPVSAAIVRDWLLEQLAPNPAAGRRFIGVDELRDAAFVGAARLLLPAADAQRAHELGSGRTARYFQVLDSFGFRPVRSSDERRPVRHRLIVTDGAADPALVALLLPGCEKATVLVLSDMFGMADYSKYDSWVGGSEIHVEHTRTRITRFSRTYTELHEASARVAERAVDEVAAIPGVLHEDDRRYLAVALADFLFFRTLRIRALEILLEDDTFDDVVVAVSDNGAQNEFLLLLAQVPGLRHDPRVDIVSVVPGWRRRVDFWRVLDTVLAPTPRPPRVADHLCVDLIVDSFLADARRLADELRWAEPEEPGWILLATCHNPAYNTSTAAYAAELVDTRPVRILRATGPAAELADALKVRGVADRVPVMAGPPKQLRDAALTDLVHRRLLPLCHELRAAATTVYEDDAAKSFDIFFARLVAGHIVPWLLRQKAYEHRFERLREAGRLPGAVILSPQRDPGVVGLAGVARRAGVPTIALEPHMQDANYSRYLKIAADYYGVFSEYFVDNAVGAFGMPRDRVHVIGTPRLVAPSGHDRGAAQASARAALTAGSGFDFSAAPLHVVFMGQPSSWHQLERVWHIVVDASRRVGAHVFLKPHPEESPSRVRRYLDRGVAAHVTLLSGDAANAVDLADLVLTTYSTAAVDAAIRQTPVVSVADGDTRYPIDVTAIVDAPVARSTDELVAIFEAYLRNPRPALRRASTLTEREPHFVTGPGPNLRRLLDEVVSRGADGRRSADELPPSLFLDGPHPVFPV